MHEGMNERMKYILILMHIYIHIYRHISLDMFICLYMCICIFMWGIHELVENSWSVRRMTGQMARGGILSMVKVVLQHGALNRP